MTETCHQNKQILSDSSSLLTETFSTDPPTNISNALTQQSNSRSNTAPEQKISKQMMKKLKKKEQWQKTRSFIKKQKRKKRIEQKWTTYATKEEYLRSEQHKKVKFQEEMKKKWKSVTIDEITWYKPWIVVDLDWNDVLTEKEMTSLAAQLMHIYGAMKRSDRPLKLYLTSLKGKIKEILYKITGAQNWKVVQEERDYLQLFPQNQLVYLSPESNNILRFIDPERVYIIGGLVDHNRLKGASFKKATAQGIETAKLPVNEYIERFANTSLNVNHVFEILMDVARDGEWMTAFVKHVPTRKGYIRRDENENESEQPASKKRKNETNNTNNNSHKEDENMTSIK